MGHRDFAHGRDTSPERSITLQWPSIENRYANLTPFAGGTFMGKMHLKKQNSHWLVVVYPYEDSAGSERHHLRLDKALPREKAKEEASEFRYNICTPLGRIKNRHRYLSSTVVEMELTQGVTTIFSAQRLATVLKHTWSAHKVKCKTYTTWYAYATGNKPMHAIFFGSWYNHKNGIELDNRDENLEKTTPKENANDRALRSDNKSGYNAISKYSRGWAAQWCENGKLKSKKFSVKKFGCSNEAKHAAVKYRKAQATRLKCKNGKRKNRRTVIYRG